MNDRLEAGGWRLEERPNGRLEPLAFLLEYPREGFADGVAAAAAAVGADVAPKLAEIQEFASTHTLGECEELHVRTFDGNAERALEVGWQVFGEQYARGAFLVKLRNLLREHGVPESSELPDHLTHVLRLLPHLPAEEATALIDNAVRPSLDRVLRSFAGEDSPYVGVLEAVRAVVTAPGGDA